MSSLTSSRYSPSEISSKVDLGISTLATSSVSCVHSTPSSIANSIGTMAATSGLLWASISDEIAGVAIIRPARANPAISFFVNLLSRTAGPDFIVRYECFSFYHPTKNIPACSTQKPDNPLKIAEQVLIHQKPHEAEKAVLGRLPSCVGGYMPCN